MAAPTCRTARDELSEDDDSKAAGLHEGAVPFRAHMPRAVGMTDEVSDREIADGVYRGERWAAAALYARVRRSVERALLRVLRYGDHEREDLMQEAFEKMVRALGKKKQPRDCNLPGWASAVATNLALDHLRRRGRERRLFGAADEQTLLVEAPHEGRNLESREQLRITQHVLAGMRPKYAEAFVLHDVLGHDLTEVASLCGTSVSAAQSRLSRGRRHFQERIVVLQGRKPPTMDRGGDPA